MKFLAIVTSFTLTFIAFAILATKLFYPYHRALAFFVYAFGWVFFIWSLYSKRKLIIDSGEVAERFIMQYGAHVTLAFFLVLFAYFAWVLIPLEKTFLTDIPPKDFAKYIQDDTSSFMYIERGLSKEVQNIETNPIFTKDATTLSFEERAYVQKSWKNTLDYLFELDILKERYKGFYQIDYLQSPENHINSFLIAYSSFLAQNHYVLRVERRIGNEVGIKKILNDENEDMGMVSNSFDRSVDLLVHPDTVIRINAGRTYRSILGSQVSENVLVENIAKYLEYIDRNLQKYTALTLDSPLKKLESLSFGAWYPLQKKAALQLSYVRTTDRSYIISPSFAHARREHVEPADILLQRREWHATNIGIPGYWTHSAFYIGTLDEMDQYFATLTTLDNKKPSEVIARLYPDAYNQLKNDTEDVYPLSVIEAKRPGVILKSFEHSVNADSVGIIRPNITKQEKWDSILRAISFFGRGYDYDFDFLTDHALVCSEVIYKALADVEGLNFETSMVSGRVIFSPNQFVEKFDSEMDDKDGVRQLLFVAFWDGDENTSQVKERSVEEFRSSWRRPKWHIVKDYLR